MVRGDDLRKNTSGCYDPTAYEAIKHISEEERRFHDLLHTLKYICKQAGFEITERIVLTDVETGRVWR